METYKQFVILIAFSFVLASCGSDDGGGTSGPGGTNVTTISVVYGSLEVTGQDAVFGTGRTKFFRYAKRRY